ncbi:hypothetical protein P4C99_09170 [Pontiellaceae bacterium B1224]|nr:hypothetical protein [Pontiellaceae bacterium B1224]
MDRSCSKTVSAEAPAGSTPISTWLEASLRMMHNGEAYVPPEL